MCYIKKVYRFKKYHISVIMNICAATENRRLKIYIKKHFNIIRKTGTDMIHSPFTVFFCWATIYEKRVSRIKRKQDVIAKDAFSKNVLSLLKPLRLLFSYAGVNHYCYSLLTAKNISISGDFPSLFSVWYSYSIFSAEYRLLGSHLV